MTEDDQVRRLLADARHTAPMPDDVADRLDGVLADLRSDRPVRPGVADLAAARRRRRARSLLVAAAAIVVVGVGIDQVRSAGGGDAGGSADSAASAESRDAPDDAGGAARADASADPDARFESDDRPVDGQLTLGRVPRVGADDFGSTAQRLRKQRRELRFSFVEGQNGVADSAAKDACLDDDTRGSGQPVRIRYEGSPAVLVYRPPRGDTQVVDLYLCGGDEVTRSITLPAP